DEGVLVGDGDARQRAGRAGGQGGAGGAGLRQREVGVDVQEGVQAAGGLGGLQAALRQLGRADPALGQGVAQGGDAAEFGMQGGLGHDYSITLGTGNRPSADSGALASSSARRASVACSLTASSRRRRVMSSW